mgnify:FL=1
MNDAHLHLAINHFPIIVPFIGLIVMIGGIILKSNSIQRTSFAIFIIAAISTLGAMATGEGAAEMIENMSQVESTMIHEHEEAAELFAVMVYILGLISLVGIWFNWRKKKYANLISIVILIISAASIYFAANTGTTGGEIMHREIRKDVNAKQTIDDPYDLNKDEESEHEDDD